MSPHIAAIFVGGPKSLSDSRGEWRSSLRRDPATCPVTITRTGILGDSNAQPYHGGPDAALCVHLAEHYTFWQHHLGLPLQPGAVGENLTLRGIPEDQVFVGDTVRLGSATAQVSGPRVPCANLARHLGRPDWVRATIRENRTGFYLRVLEPGTAAAGDPWVLLDRLQTDLSIPAINRCMYLNFDPALALRMLTLPALGAWWQQQAREKLASHDQHWTTTLLQS